MYAIWYIKDGNIKTNVTNWLTNFKETAFEDIDSNPANGFDLNGTIMLKQSEIISSIKNFINKGEKKNDIIQ